MTTVTCREFGKPPVEVETGERDPHGIPNDHPGAKADAGKLRAGLCLIGFIPALCTFFPGRGDDTSVIRAAAKRWPYALLEIAKVTTVGARKYTPNGWLKVPDGSDRYLDAWGRHVLASGLGQVHDDGPGGTGCLHMAQACWNLLAALTLARQRDTLSESELPLTPWEMQLCGLAFGEMEGLEAHLRCKEGAATA